jgi:choline dehydrogenase
VCHLPGVGQNLIDHPLQGLAFATSAPEAGEILTEVGLTLKSTQAGQGHDLMILPTNAWADSGASRFMIFASLVKPRSRGVVSLRSSDPSDAPIIDLGYFTDPADMPRLVEGVREARRLSRVSPLAGLVLEETYPGPAVPDTDEALEAVIKERVETFHHPVGTCRMGPSGDPFAVVDATGKVQGVDGLWVIDASIMPDIPSANPNLAVIMAAERCAAWQ